MSFNDLETAESPRYSDFPEFEELSQTIENILYNVNNNQLVSLKKLLTQYENEVQPEDHASGADKVKKISAKISSLVTKTTTSFKNVNEKATSLNQYLNECDKKHEDGDTLEYLRQKESILINLIKSSINQFQKQQKKFQLLEETQKKKFQENQTALESATATTNTTEGESAGDSQNMVQITYEPINAEELEEQSLLIQEREREIHQISQDITEINDIFSNLHELVTEQQTTLDNIEDNILMYSEDARGATVELRRAERYQKRSSGRMACCLAILLGVLGTIIFIGVVF